MADDESKSIEIKVFGAWLFSLPYPIRQDAMEELTEKGTLPGMKLVHMLSGEWNVRDLPRLRKNFDSWLPKVRDPRCYLIMLGMGSSGRCAVYPLKEER